MASIKPFKLSTQNIRTSGFRPKRGCYDVIKEVHNRMYSGKINYIVDADIKGFFEHMNHGLIMKSLGVYIKVPLYYG